MPLIYSQIDVMWCVGVGWDISSQLGSCVTMLGCSPRGLSVGVGRFRTTHIASHGHFLGEMGVISYTYISIASLPVSATGTVVNQAPCGSIDLVQYQCVSLPCCVLYNCNFYYNLGQFLPRIKRDSNPGRILKFVLSINIYKKFII